MLAWPLRALVRIYRWIVSPILPAACRFHPSCSVYAEEALATHGFVRGGALTAWRVCRCHPFHPGGYDPVPPPPGRSQPIDPASSEPSPPASISSEPAQARTAGEARTSDGSAPLLQEDACAHC